MATISSAGIGSGLDVESIITKLVALEKQPITQLKTKAASVQAKLSTYAQVKSLMSTFSDAASKLTLDRTWDAKAVTSSNSAAVSASISGVANATSFSMEVQQLARQQSVASASRSPVGTAVGAGTLTLQLGTWSGTDTASPIFAEGTVAAVDIAVSATDTLTSIATQINDKGMGVTATVLKDASGERLLVRSSKTGADAGFRVQVTETGGTGLSSLSFDPQNAPDVGIASSEGSAQYAQNTKASINGITMTSSDNMFNSAIDGLNISVFQVTTAPVEVKVSNDVDSIKKTIQAFVDSYNSLNDLLSSSTKYDSETKSAAVLQGDNTAVSLMNLMRNTVASAMSGVANSVQRLTDIGIDIKQGGKLMLVSGDLDKALKDLPSVKKMFANNAGAGSVSNGLAVKVKATMSDLLSLDGLMNNKEEALNAVIKRNSDEQEKVTARAASVEKRLRTQYTALDKQMAGLTALNAYVSQQVAAWNKSTG